MESNLGFEGYFETLIAALEVGRDVPVGYQEARRSLAIVRAAYQSSAEGRPVTVDA